ncbi:hypothetical protein COU75_04695 [Candidatus Peregrinibacteria bacterium CG10_big_fil_rev_8_21_14_0_10_42_8]|nr:MAG: hypothetical protein COU75_04695 [Candidatus Peregrinibacteria bacterium CG10_big_fil_rev_8_21_14_0_10_42_8]
MIIILFFGIQTISLLVLILFMHEYKRIAYKHQTLLQSIEDDSTPRSINQSTIIIWIYAAITFSILIGTTFFFFSIITSL